MPCCQKLSSKLSPLLLRKCQPLETCFFSWFQATLGRFHSSSFIYSVVPFVHHPAKSQAASFQASVCRYANLLASQTVSPGPPGGVNLANSRASRGEPFGWQVGRSERLATLADKVLARYLRVAAAALRSSSSQHLSILPANIMANDPRVVQATGFIRESFGYDFQNIALVREAIDTSGLNLIQALEANKRLAMVGDKALESTIISVWYPTGAPRGK